MLMEQLFSSGLMQMGSSRIDPARQVGVFNPSALASFPTLRSEKMKQFDWILGEWIYENIVPATSANPAYTDVGSGHYALDENGSWLCMLRDGKQIPQITFDPFSRQWIYVLMNGAYGMLRSYEGWVDYQLTFSGQMTMLGITCDWRMRWTKENPDRFSFINEERADNGEWVYIDEWRFVRKA